ncbi:MAG TPA: DUF58 domain-containing protein [Mycobacteriales bacterium]|nr:DUF58 domain-containing protein [Mycobacteriales bacterium]
MTRLAQFFSALTVRGRCLLAAGVAASASAGVLHEINVLRIGVLLLALPVLAYVMVARTRYRLTCTRRLDPVRVAAGRPAEVRLRLQNVSRLPTGLMLAEDTVPYLLGGRPRFVLDRVLPQRAIDVDYTVRSQLRGRYRIGPLTVRLTDPFGLCELTRSFASADTLVVTPQVVPLPDVRLGGDWAGAGESRARSVATSGEDDAATREYRQGDDLRRIHWRSTARLGELMVRREEQPWQSRAVLLVDCRGSVHHGDGAASSLEWTMSAAASVGLHLSRGGFTMRVVTDAGDEVTTGSVGVDAFDSVLLDNLAVRTASATTSIRTGCTAVRRGGGEELLVAIVGPLSSEDAQSLSRIAQGGPSVGIGLVLDTASWTTLAPRAAASAARAHRETCDVLAAAGWRVLPVTAGASLAELWPATGAGLAAAAGREAARLAAAAEVAG